MEAVYRYFSGDSDVPYVIHGDVGTGKTFLMAGVSRMLRDKFPLQKKVLVLRFIGHTPRSSNIRNLLRSICEQVTQRSSVGLEKGSCGTTKKIGNVHSKHCDRSMILPYLIMVYWKETNKAFSRAKTWDCW